jgi:hypothetical protein
MTVTEHCREIRLVRSRGQLRQIGSVPTCQCIGLLGINDQVAQINPRICEMVSAPVPHGLLLSIGWPDPGRLSTSQTLSTNYGSLTPSTNPGCTEAIRMHGHTREAIDCDSPRCSAIDRVEQYVASAGRSQASQ